MPTTPAPSRPAGRYGERRALPRPLVVGSLAVLAALGVAWVVWAGLGLADRDVRWTDVGVAVRTDDRTEVTFDVVMDPGSRAECLVRALDGTRGEVGLAEVVVGPSEQRVVRTTVEVPTRERAVSGGVRTCEVLEPSARG